MDQLLNARSVRVPAPDADVEAQQLRARLLAAEQLEAAVLKADAAPSGEKREVAFRRCVALAEAHRIVRTRPDWSVRIAELLTQVADRSRT